MFGDEWYLDYYVTATGRSPYREWFNSLRNEMACAVIEARLTRLRAGNFEKCEPVGDGVYELKIYYGPGYRVYFGRKENRVILLVFGGEKSTQAKDIVMAQRYWQDFKERRR